MDAQLKIRLWQAIKRHRPSFKQTSKAQEIKDLLWLASKCGLYGALDFVHDITEANDKCLDLLPEATTVLNNCVVLQQQLDTNLQMLKLAFDNAKDEQVKDALATELKGFLKAIRLVDDALNNKTV